MAKQKNICTFFYWRFCYFVHNYLSLIVYSFIKQSSPKNKSCDTSMKNWQIALSDFIDCLCSLSKWKPVLTMTAALLAQVQNTNSELRHVISHKSDVHATPGTNKKKQLGQHDPNRVKVFINNHYIWWRRTILEANHFKTYIYASSFLSGTTKSKSQECDKLSWRWAKGVTL